MTTKTANNQKHSYMAPFIIMVVLMSLVGLITSINQQFQAPMQSAYLIMGGNMTNTLTTLLVFAFFLAYLVMGIPSSRYIQKKGHKTTLITGLVILICAFGLYQLSAYVFTNHDLVTFQPILDQAKAMGDGFKYEGPTVVPVAYYIFLFAAFVAGTALTFLQAVINPYIVACEVPGTTGVTRQSIAGTGNSLMTTIGPLLVAFLIFNGKTGLEINITSLYIPILVLMVIVGIIAAVLPSLDLPEIPSTSVGKDETLPDSILSFRHLVLGVAAIFFYVGVEVCVGSNINLFAIKEGGFTIASAAKLASLYWFGMLIGRAVGSFLSGIAAHTQLLVASLAAMILVIASMVTGNPWLLCGVGLFHSIMWPAIFDLAIKGLGRYTAKGSGLLMMGVVGGAVLPLLQGVLADSIGNWTWTWTIVIVGELYLLYYAFSGHKVKKTDVGHTAEN